MTSNECQCIHRILVQFDQDGRFETEEPDKIRYVGFLQDEGFVIAQFTPQDGAPFTKAAIQRLTSRGSEKIRLLAPEDSIVQDLDYAQILRDAEDIRRESSRSYDTMIKTIATGGLGIIATMFLYSGNLPQPLTCWMKILCYGAVLIWIANLIALLVLDRISQVQQWKLTVAAHRRDVDAVKVNQQSQNMDKWNFINGMLCLLGLIAFLAFVALFITSKG